MMPAGSEILWWGGASSVPEGWAVDTTTYGAFIRGSTSDSSGVTGSATHNHSNPATTSWRDSHTHTVGASWSGHDGGWRGPGDNDGVHRHVANRFHNHGVSAWTNSQGGHSHTLSSTNNATVYPPYRRLYFIQATEEAEFPVNGIMMFGHNSSNLPPDFVICNGSNNTPDLRSRFVWGAASDADLGNVGGATTHTHGNSSTGSSGGHSHTLSATLGSSTSHIGVSAADNWDFASHGHTHSASRSSGADSNHSHTLGSTGNGSSLPPFLRLWFVMRVE